MCHYQSRALCLVMFVGTGWARQGPRHGRFQLWRSDPRLFCTPAAAFGSGASAVAGGSAYALLCVIASGAGQSATTGWQRQVDEASVSYLIPIWG